MLVRVERYVALLRGVNVGGRNRVPMKELRELFVEAGFEAVATLIQSGNVVFSAPGPPSAPALAASIEARFGVTTAVVVRHAAGLARAVRENPFAEVPPERVHVGFLSAAPDPAALGALDLAAYLPERVAVLGTEAYFDLPGGMGNARLPGVVDRRLSVTITVRNLRTTLRLAELAAGTAG